MLSLSEYLEGTRLDKVQQILHVKRNKEEDVENLCGIFSEYARPELSKEGREKLENEAWASAAVERYLRNYDIA